MREFGAKVHATCGKSRTVTVSVDRRESAVDIVVHHPSKDITFTMGNWELNYLIKLNNGGYCSDSFGASCSIYDGKENHRIEISANKYTHEGLWMEWEEYWQDEWVTKSEKTVLSMNKYEAHSFLQYIIKGFTE